MTAATIVALFVAALPLLLLVVFTAEVLAGLQAQTKPVVEGPLPRTVVLIPAHNEAADIVATIAALRASTDSTINLLIVADNCTDNTAALARASGAQVIERHDPVRRGKGYALAFGRDHLALTSPPDCVVVLDADCTVAGAGIAALARMAVHSKRAVQACNLQRPDLTGSPTAQISSFAFLIKNLVRQRGMVRIGGVAALTGTGMAIPWPLFGKAPLATADLAEDMALGVWLTLHEQPPYFLEAVQIWSDAASGRALLTQRNRWERGFLMLSRRQALPLLAKGLTTVSRSQSWLGLHILVPPLALLFVIAATALVLTLLLALLGASLSVAILLASASVAAGMVTIAAWHVAGREQISAAALWRIPLYVAAKLPLYRAILGRRNADGWVRTRRSDDKDAPR